MSNHVATHLPSGAKGFMYFESEMSLYEPFMKDPDGQRLLDAAKGTRLEAPMADLMQAWRGTHCARGMPWLMARSGVSAAAGALEREMPPFTGSQMFQLLATRIANGKLPRAQGRELERQIRKVGVEMESRLREEAKKPPTEDAFQAAWNTYLTNDQFKMSLEASEISAYLGLYFAYENLVARAVEVRSGTWPTSTSKIGKGFRAEFGEPAWKSFWDEGIVAAGRHVRDAFAHRGGRANTETQNFGTHLLQDQGYILIGASHTNALYAGLRDCVLGLVKRMQELDGAPPSPAAHGP